LFAVFLTGFTYFDALFPRWQWKERRKRLGVPPLAVSLALDFPRGTKEREGM
jgi:hypothetical protein